MAMKLSLPLLLAFWCAGSATAGEAALAVVQKISSTVGFYTVDGKHLVDVKTRPHPHEAILSLDKRFLYVTENGILWMTDAGEGGNSIAVIDVEARQSAGVIDLGEYRRPHGIDLDTKTGKMLVTIENPDGILLIDPVARKVLRKYDVQGADPHMVLFGPNGEYAYVSNTATGTVAAVHLETGRVKLIDSGARPQGSVLSHDGKLLYVVNSEGNSIAIIDTGTQERVGLMPTGKGPGRIALTPDGRTLVYCLGEGEAVGFTDIASRTETGVVPLGGRPLSLTMTPNGSTVYAGIQDQDKVHVISAAQRKIIRTIHTPKGSGPDPAIPLP